MNLLDDTIHAIQPLDAAAMADARARQDQLIKPRGSMGRLEELTAQLAGITRNPRPTCQRKAIITMAGDHGIVAAGVSPYPQAVTAQMVAGFLAGRGAVNVLGRLVDARVIVVDIGVAADLPPHPQLLDKKIARGTANMLLGPAMTRDQARRAVETGIATVQSEVDRGLDIVGTGDMGIGNTTPSSAICATLTGAPLSDVTGRGAGLDDAQLANKVKVIREALSVNRPDPHDALDVLAKIGGFEIGGLAGVMLGAAARHVPVVIDGFISGAAALIAVGLAPHVKPYLIAAHRSVEPGHRIMLAHLGLTPLLDLDMRLGEGTGAALGLFLAEASTRILAEMPTFAEAGVSDKED